MTIGQRFIINVPLIISLFSLVLSMVSFWYSFRTTRLLQRAYVYHTAELQNKDELVKAISEKAFSIPVSLVFRMTNYGNTPARKLNYTFQYTVPAKTILSIGKDKLSDVDIPPKESRLYGQHLEFKSIAGERLESDSIYTGVTGKVSYEDVFGARHEVTLSYVLIATGKDARLSTCEQQESGNIRSLMVPSREGFIIRDKPQPPIQK